MVFKFTGDEKSYPCLQFSLKILYIPKRFFPEHVSHTLEHILKEVVEQLCTFSQSSITDVLRVFAS